MDGWALKTNGRMPPKAKPSAKPKPKSKRVARQGPKSAGLQRPGVWSNPAVLRTRLEGSRVEKGSVVLGAAYARASTNPIEHDLSWFSFAQRRFGKMFQLYDYVTYRRLAVEFVPERAATAPGRFMMYIDSDPSDVSADSNAGILDNQNAVSCHITHGVICEMPGPSKRLYTTPRVAQWRWSCPGTLVYSSEAHGLTDGNQIGMLIMHYEVLFEVPSTPCDSWEQEKLDFTRLTVPGATDRVTSPLAPHDNLVSCEGTGGAVTPVTASLYTFRVNPASTIRSLSI